MFLSLATLSNIRACRRSPGTILLSKALLHRLNVALLGITTTPHRNCLLLENFSALESGYRRGHISTVAEAELAVPRAHSAIDT